MFIRTSRLLLRPHFPEDARILYAAIADLRVVRMLSRAPWPYHLADAEAYCARPQDPTRLNFAVTLPELPGAPIIGGVGLDDSEGVHELGYWIAPPFWDHGYATEAVGGVLELAKALGIDRIEAAHFTENLVSGCVLLKNGFVPTGELVPVPCRGRGGEEVPALRYARDLLPQEELSLTVAA